MSSNPAFDKHVQLLVDVLDEYTHWFMQLLRRIQYPKSAEELQTFNKPTAFIDWLEKAEGFELRAEALERLQDVHNDLSVLADTLVNETMKSEEAPEFNACDKLMTYFEEFTLQIRRLEKELFVDNSGFDDVTGLRSIAMLHDDYSKEMERVSRQGKPFSVAVVKIKNTDEISANKEEAIKLVSDLIKESMRSFDDAYRINDYEFVWALKQADTGGGMIALKRLENKLKAADLKGAMPKIISCIAEPAPGDELDQLIENIKSELNSFDDEDAGIIEYMDISPLQRFVKQGGD